MTKVVLDVENLTDVHFNILRAVNNCHGGCGDAQSLLTASGVIALMSRILPDEMESARSTYVKAVSELRCSGWIEDDSRGRTFGLVRYWPSDKAQAVLRSQLASA